MSIRIYKATEICDITSILVRLRAQVRFGPAWAACHLDSLAQVAQSVGVRNKSLHLKLLLQERCDLLDDVCREDALEP